MNLVRFMNNRVPPNKRYQPTEYEHAANCATHALWIIPSLLGSSVLHFQSEDRWERVSAWVYGAGLSSLFIISTLFHTVAWKKSHLRYTHTRTHKNTCTYILIQYLDCTVILQMRLKDVQNGFWTICILFWNKCISQHPIFVIEI